MVYHYRLGTCWYPRVHGITVMVNSIFNGWRFEEAWLDTRDSAKSIALRRSAPHAEEPMVCMTHRWREPDSNHRSPDRQDGFRSSQNRRSHGRARPSRRPVALI